MQPNETIINTAAQDIRHARQFLDIAARTLDRAQRSIASQADRCPGMILHQVAAQCADARRVADRAIDAASAINDRALDGPLAAGTQTDRRLCAHHQAGSNCICADGAVVVP